MPSKRGFVCILANRRHGTLYIGVTSNLPARMRTHKGPEASGFVRRYGVTRLVYVEEHDRITDAIQREKQVKAWKRAWKIRLIESVNPEWEELFDAVMPDRGFLPSQDREASASANDGKSGAVCCAYRTTVNVTASSGRSPAIRAR